MLVKVCGITNADDALTAAQAGADFIGLILASSVRQIDVPRARAIVAALPERHPEPVLVFRDAPAGLIADALRKTDCRWVQLHGQEPPDLCGELRRLVPFVRLIRAFELGPQFPEASILNYLKAAAQGGNSIDVMLLDRPKSTAAADPGSQHQIMAHFARSIRSRPPLVWCAGGLSPSNVGAVAALDAFDGVDVAGGVERAPGLKSPAAVAAFVSAARAARGHDGALSI